MPRKAHAPEQVQLLPAEASDVSTITAQTKDLDRELVIAAGGDWRTYWEKNGGRVPWCHDYTLLDVGRGAWIVPTSKGATPGWMAKTIYHPRPGPEVLPEGQPWFPAIVQYYVMELGLRGKSIGFVPLDIRKPSHEELGQHGADLRLVHARWIGLEYSIAPIQCNPDAVREMALKARSKGIITPREMFEGFGVIVPGDSASQADWLKAIAAGPTPTANVGRRAAAEQDGESAAERRATSEPVLTAADVRKQIRAAVAGVPAMVRETIETMRGRV
jgi:hypothetical protein